MQSLDRIRRSNGFPLAFWKARESKELIAGFFQAGRRRETFQPPFSQESFSFGFHFLPRFGVDHVFIVGREFLVQALWRMRQQIAMLMNRAALDQDIRPERGERFVEAGSAIDDHKLWGSQAAFDEIVEKSAPSGFAFAAHVLDGKQNFLSVRPDAKRDEQRNRRRLFVEPHAHDRAVEDEPDDRLFGERTGVPDPMRASCGRGSRILGCVRRGESR